MTLKDKRNETLQAPASPLQAHAEGTSANHAPNHDEIRRRAYDIYLGRGGAPGHELEDWLQAESEIGKAELSIQAKKGAQQEA
jgi:hypothetical protein